jgi:hypothetical protein
LNRITTDIARGAARRSSCCFAPNQKTWIGEVQQLQTTVNGVVDAVIVEIGDGVAALPADNFTVSGETLISPMSRGEVRQEARDQQNGG